MKMFGPLHLFCYLDHPMSYDQGPTTDSEWSFRDTQELWPDSHGAVNHHGRPMFTVRTVFLRCDGELCQAELLIRRVLALSPQTWRLDTRFLAPAFWADRLSWTQPYGHHRPTSKRMGPFQWDSDEFNSQLSKLPHSLSMGCFDCVCNSGTQLAGVDFLGGFGLTPKSLH